MSKWYVMYVNHGKEQLVIDMIKKDSEKFKFIEDVVAPVEKMVAAPRSKNKEIMKRALPGCVFIKTEYLDSASKREETMPIIRQIKYFAGFLGGNAPLLVRDSEVQALIDRVNFKREIIESTPSFVVGDNVKITDGAFEGFMASVQLVNIEQSTLNLSISIFGRDTSLTLSFSQVKKESN